MDATPDWTPQAAVARRRIAVVVNARSRRGRELFDQAVAGLKERGFTVAAAHAVANPRKLGAVLAKVIADGHDVIAVGGGDGTLASAAGRMSNHPLVMAVLPLGTANSFARGLGIEPTLDSALDAIAGGRLARVDVGRIGDAHFINSATIGVPARIAEDIPHGLKRWLGRVGYLAYGFVKFLRMRPFTVTITPQGGRAETHRVMEVRIGNGAFVGGLRVIEGADPTSRDLVVHLVRSRYTAALARVWAANLAGWSGPSIHVKELRLGSFDLSCSPQQPISVDGETGTRTPVAVSVAPGALHLIVPAA